MSVPVEKKINMSLGDIIAANKQPKKAAAPKKKVAAKPAPTTNAGKNKRTKKGGNGTVPALVKVTKAAKSVGVAQAKRAATTAQRRGLSNNAAPTKAALKQQVNRAAAKQTRQLQNSQSQGSTGRRGNNNNNNSNNSRQNNGRPASAPAAVPSLKISFRPDELKKTTEKNVSAQIRAVLGKTTGNNNNNNTARSNNSGNNKSVISRVTSNSAGARRGNPKSRRPVR